MRIRLATSLLVTFCCAMAVCAQTGLTIKKKATIKIPGMETMPRMPNGAASPLNDRASTVYIKGARMRTDSQMEVPKMSGFGGGMKTVTFSHILQCDKQRSLIFNSDKKKYFQEPMGGSTVGDSQKAGKGGYVTVTGSVTDTGNRSKLFGYDAKHLKQTLTFTPSKGACMKDTLTVETEGWYAELPEFVCPIKRRTQDFQISTECYDQVVDDVKGVITGFALKEIKMIRMQGQTVSIEEEVVSLNKTTLADSLFEVPANYVPANTLKEVQDDSDGAPVSAEAVPANVPSTDFPVPVAGLEPVAIGVKKPAMIRIGVVMPKITTPESKKDPTAGEDVALSAQNYLIESLKAGNVEAVPLATNSDDEAAKLGCDYILTANITQKRGGSGMFKSMVLMGATSMLGGMIPGVGGIIGSTIAGQVMGQTMGKAARAKDEFTLDYQIVGSDKALLSKAVSKKKAEKDGDDVLSPQIKEASVKILEEIAKKTSK